MQRASGSVLATKYPPVSSVTCIHHVAAPNFLPNFSPCLQLPLASDKHGWRRLERAQPPRKSSGRLLARHGRRDAACRTYTYCRERGSIAFRCKKAQPRTPAIVVLLIGHRNRSGKTHKLDQLVVEERERLPSQARDDNATPHFMPSRSPSRCLSLLLSRNLYFIFVRNFSSLV